MDFDQYIFNRNEVINKKEVPGEIFEKYQEILPEEVLGLWSRFGFSGISGGLINLINPDDYKPVRQDWESVNNVLALKDQKEYLIAYSAFGDFVFFVTEETRSEER
ncbi:MAG: GAD-like domain-containing protein, partial [Spirochaetales bacterium]|nr:GAD-like domain-containing protein [Spirochaetales bacterium]